MKEVSALWVKYSQAVFYALSIWWETSLLYTA